jgi:hypothetical protein
MSTCFWRVIGRARKSGVREHAKYILPTSLASASLITEREETTMNYKNQILKKSPFRTAKWKRVRISPFRTAYTATICEKEVVIEVPKRSAFFVEIKNDEDLGFKLFDYGGHFDRYEWALVTLQDRVEELIKSEVNK